MKEKIFTTGFWIFACLIPWSIAFCLILWPQKLTRATEDAIVGSVILSTIGAAIPLCEMIVKQFRLIKKLQKEHDKTKSKSM